MVCSQMLQGHVCNDDLVSCYVILKTNSSSTDLDESQPLLLHHFCGKELGFDAPA